ncbi:hypothetical protein FKV23_10365 [Lysobacter alkalisoli]|uniref:Uncharacterized protein n=2 Tax=Marilutibacter alkalisoli TaxID=2591633 RepID=A0A514BST5_9GAMM|nr:hypothetical protein FKV23_10365 [Lysobacter alkalisoli]
MLRRVLVITALAWLPLLALSLVEGHAVGGVAVPFLADVEAYARFLIAIPILLVAELVVHQRLWRIVDEFRERDIVALSSRPRFDEALAAAMRLRNSTIVEVALLILVFVLGPVLWKNGLALHVDTWYARVDAGRSELTGAGVWLAHASIPIFQFLLLRWYFRLAIWWRFLWQVSRLPLDLKALHPDRAGGLGFLGDSVFAFAPLLVAQSVLLSGIVFSRVLTGTGTATEFQGEIALLVTFLVAQIIGPLLFFTSGLGQARRRAMHEFGMLATAYARDFERRWMQGAPPEADVLLGSADIQSLADLASSSDILSGMRSVPFDWRTLFRLVVATSAPFFPLVLTVIPFVELVRRVLEMMM